MGLHRAGKNLEPGSVVTEARRLGAAICIVGRGSWGALLCPPALCQLPQGGSYSGSGVSCFAQAQTAANRNGGVCHTVYRSGLGAGGLPQASLPPAAPPAVTLGSERGRGPDAAQGLGGSHLAAGKSARSLGDGPGGFRIGPQDTAGGPKGASAPRRPQRLCRGTFRESFRERG